MRCKRLVLLTTVVIGTVCVGQAAAKGPDRANVCGWQRCRMLSGEAAASPLLTSWWLTPFDGAAAPTPAPSYRFTLHSARAGEGRWFIVWVPSAREMRVTQVGVYPYLQRIGPYWRAVPPNARRVFRRVTSGLRPYPASKMRPS